MIGTLIHWCWICKGYHEPPTGCQPCVDSQLAARDADLAQARATIEGLREACEDAMYSINNRSARKTLSDALAAARGKGTK